jgi:hypothetical protein
LNFSNKTFAIIGLHLEEGRGIIFNDLFQQRLFEWIVNQDDLQITGRADLEFAII